MESDQPDQPPIQEPMDADAYFERGIAFGLNDEYEKAIADLTQAIQLNPTKAKYHNQRASRHFIQSNWPEAIVDYTTALSLKPDLSDDDVWNFTIDEAYHGRGIAYRYQGNYEAALADFAELISLQPNKISYYLDRSVIYKLKGDFERSFADLNIVQRLDPNDRTYLTLMADLHQRQGNNRAAMETYNQEVERFGSPASYFYRGVLWKSQGNLAEAIADFEEAIKLYPQYDIAYINLAGTYLAYGSFAKAIDVLDAVIKIRPGYRYIAVYLRGRTYLASGNLEQANIDFAETITITTEDMAEYPLFTEGYVVRGHAYAALGQIQEAISDYNIALELDPIHQEARLMREYIAKNA